MSPELRFSKKGAEHVASVPDQTGKYYIEGIGNVHLNFDKITPTNSVNILYIITDQAIMLHKSAPWRSWKGILESTVMFGREVHLSPQGTGKVRIPPDDIEVDVRLHKPIRERGWWARRHVIDPKTKQRMGTEYVRRSTPRGI